MIRVLFKYQKSLGRKVLGLYYKIYLRLLGCKVGRNFKCLGFIHFREVPKYTQIGNAVPVKLAEEVGKHFQELPFSNYKRMYGEELLPSY